MTAFFAGAQNSSAGGETITSAERTQLLGTTLPGALSTAEANEFLNRWNQTVQYWGQGIYTASQVPSGQSTDFLDVTALQQAFNSALTAEQQSQADGYSDPLAELEGALTQVHNDLAGMGVCATVKLQIDQSATLTRSAFTGTLSLTNSEGTGAMTNVAMNINITDTAGNPANGEFFISSPTYSGAFSVVNGHATLPNNSTGSITFTFIPDDSAASSTPTIYDIGGTITFTDPSGGAVSIPVFPATITVYPQAQLHLNYFLQKDVFGSEPAVLGLLVTNAGLGTANNLSIATAQPQIVQNDKGLADTFTIIGTQVGTQLAPTPSLTVDLGNVAPGKTADADFLLLSQLPGIFTDFTASFSHSDALGGQDTSLITSVQTHTLIHAGNFKFPGSTGEMDYLAENNANVGNLPDTIYFSDGTTAPVSTATNAQSAKTAPNAYTVTANVTTGWDYLQLPDPGAGFALSKVVRSDGTVLPISDQAWTTDRNFNAAGTSTVDYELHILDFNSTGSYTMYYVPVTQTPPSSSVAALSAFSPSSFKVSWSGSDATGPGIASYSIYVSDNGGPFTPWLTGDTQTSATYVGMNGHTYSFYSVAADNAGLVQPTPTGAQAMTTVDMTPPTSTVAALPAITNTATFTVSWSGNDNTGGSGIAGFDIFVSDNGGPFTPLLTGTPQTSTQFTGQAGHTYGFYSVATDAVGNRQATPAGAEATTLVQAIATVQVSSDHQQGSTYGQTVAFTATVSASLASAGTPTGSLQFQIDGVNFGAPATLTSGTASFNTSALPAGQHAITANYTSNSKNFGNSSGSSSASVSPAILTVSADNKSMVYGGSLPALTLSYSGFVNGENASVLSGSASLSTTATASSGAGTYAITVTQGTLSAVNYTFSLVSGTLTIARATPTVAVSDAGGTYNGQAYPATATVAGVVPGVDSTPAANLEGVAPTFTYYAGNTASGTPLGAAPAGAGTYTVVASFAGSADYTAASDSTTFTIDAATPTVAVTDQGGIYNDQPYPATATVAGVVGGVDKTPAASLEGVTPTLAYYAGSTASGTALSGPPSLRGTYTVVASFAGSADYAAASASTTFTIAPAMPDLVVTDAGGIYNGQPYPATATVAGVVVGVDDTPGASLEGVSVSLSYFAGSTASGTPLSGAPSLTGTYTALVSFAGSADYAAGSASTMFTITPATPSVAVADAGGIYKGQPYPASATVAGVVPGVDTTPAASLEGVTPTLAYYAGSTASGTPLAGAPAGAGMYTVVASFAGSADYTAASAMTTYAIGQATPTIRVSDAGGTYNGQPYPATATVAGVVPGVDTTPGTSLEGTGLSLSYYAGSTASGSPLAGAPSGAGTYTVQASFAGSADYAPASANVTFTINAAMPTVAVSDAGGTWTGQPFPATATVAGVVPGVDNTPAPSLEGVSPTLTYYSGTSDTGTPLPGAPSAVGTYTVVADFAGSADYTTGSASTMFVILSPGGKTTPTIAVSDAGGTYNGQPFPATATITGTSGQPGSSLEGVSLVLTYYAGKRAHGTPLSGAPSTAGTYTVLASFAGSADYNPASRSTTFVIAMAAAKVVVADAGGTYNAKPYPATATVTGASGTAGPSLEGVSPTLAYYALGSTTKLSAAPIAAGNYTVVASFAGSTDYMPTSNMTSFTIAQAMPTVTVVDAGGTYHGVPFPATATVAGVTGIPADGLQGVKPSLAYYALGSGNTKTLLSGAPSLVGHYEVDATFAGSADYAAATAFTTFTITVAAPKVVVHDRGGIFNGQPFAAMASVAGVGVPASGSLEGVSLTLTYYAGLTPLAGAPATVGTFRVVASFPGSADYAAVSVSTTFTIARAAPKLTVSDPGGTYNGQPFAGTATVAGVMPGVDNTPSASLEGVSPSLLYYLLNSDGTKTALSGAPLTPGRYEVDAVFAGSVDYAATTRSITFAIKKATPAFSALSSPTIAKGTGSVLLSGRISLGVLIPTGQVTITIDGVSVTAQIHADGSFSASFATAALRAGKHTITYSFAGDADFRAISGKGTLTVSL